MTSAFRRKIVGRGVPEKKVPRCCIMWSSSSFNRTSATYNADHFAVLVKKKTQPVSIVISPLKAPAENPRPVKACPPSAWHNATTTAQITPTPAYIDPEDWPTPAPSTPPPPSVVSPRPTHTDTDVWPTPPPPYMPTPCMASAPFTKSPGQSHIDPEEWPTPAPTSTPPPSAQTNTDYSPSSKESRPAVSPPPSHTDGVHQRSPPPPRNLFDSATAPSPYNARQMPSSPDPSSPLAADSPHIHRPPSNPVDSSSPNFTIQAPSPKKKHNRVFTEFKTRVNFSTL